MRTPKPLTRLSLAIGLLTGATLAQADLLGVALNDPTVDMPGGGMIDYVAATGMVTISGTPGFMNSVADGIFAEIYGTGATGYNLKEITVTFRYNALGGYVEPTPDDGPDLVINGAVDLDGDGNIDYDGTLLTADVTDFGFRDGGPADDLFDLRLNNVGGLMTTPATLYGNAVPYILDPVNDLAMTVTSENSTEYPTPFSGGFDADFQGQAKALVGVYSTPGGGGGGGGGEPCRIKVNAKCSVNGGPYMEKCRIKASKSHWHWDHHDVDIDGDGHMCHMPKYGPHGSAQPRNWDKKYPATEVTFKYVVKNTGDVPITRVKLFDSFEDDGPVAVIGADLQPGETEVIYRTEALSEAFINTVLVRGKTGDGLKCRDRDTVVIKDKLKDHKKRDDDDYKDKGRRH